MKALGVVRKIDALGRIVVPKEVRDQFGWKEGHPLEMYTNEDGVFMQGYHMCCKLSGRLDDLIEVDGVYLNREVAESIAKAMKE